MKTKLKMINNYLESRNMTFRVKRCKENEYERVYFTEDIATGACLEYDIDLDETLTRTIKWVHARIKLDLANKEVAQAQRHLLTFIVREHGMGTVQRWLADIQA